ncbi:MAG TPA: ATP-binding protein [Candidatus Methylomirabilis sp.]|nr:ATP-binding protein [Candidatus Methylomirabilis sp.]
MKLLRTLRKIRNKIDEISRAADNQLYWDRLSRRIGPNSIKESPEYVIIDNKLFARTIIAGVPPISDIGGYPADMKPTVVDELLGISAKGHSIAFSYTVIPIPNVESMKMLDQAIFMNKVAQESFRDKGMDGRIDRTKQPPLRYGLEAEDFADNYREVYRNTQKMYHTAFIIVIWGDTRDALREAESHVTVILESHRIYYAIPDYRHLDTFLAAQPSPQLVDYSWCELFSYHTAALFPSRNPNSRTDENGLYFGEDMKTGKSIQIDLKALAAQHLMFVGPTGSGKTFTLLLLLMRSFDMLGKRIIYTTPKADVGTNYRHVAEYYGKAASIIDIGPRGHNINPLQILYDETILQDELDYMHAFDEHCELVNQFFKVLFEKTSINTSSTLNESLIQVYRSKGIKREDPKTWKNADWPTLLDLRAVWEKNLREDPKDVTSRALLDKTYMINTSWSYMNRPTDINTGADFIIVDISGVPQSLQEAMNVFVTGIMSMRFRTDTRKETIIAVDEGAVYLRNPQLALFLLQTLTQGRSFNISLWLATQQPSDLQKADLDTEFKTNIQISIVLGNMRKDTIAHVKSFYSLNENNVNDLMACGVGEGLVIVGDEVIPTKFTATEHEIAIIKGRKVDQKVGSPSLFALVHEGLRDLINDHQIYFQDWLVPGQDITLLSKYGYKQYKAQNINGKPGYVWLLQQNVFGDMVRNESIDHYATVLQVAAFFIMNNIPIVSINHNSDVDLIVEINGKKIAIEYERPGSHNFNELVEKRQRAETVADVTIFICQQGNLSQVIEAVGEKNTIQRGSELIERLAELIPVRTGAA